MDWTGWNNIPESEKRKYEMYPDYEGATEETDGFGNWHEYEPRMTSVFDKD